LFIAEGQWENDPSCSSYAPNPFGSKNCVKTVIQAETEAQCRVGYHLPDDFGATVLRGIG